MISIKWYSFFIFVVSSVASAQNSVSTYIYNYYQSQRALGRGNTLLTESNDYAAMLYNPANLAFKKNGEFQWNLANVGVSKGATTLLNDIKTANDTTGSDTDKSNAMAAALEKNYGSPVAVRISPQEFFWVRPNWGASLILADINLNLMIQKQLGPALDINLVKNTSFNYAQSWLLNSEMSVGALLKINHRNQFSGSYSALDLALDSKIIDFKKSKEGINLDLDLGYTWKPSSNNKNRHTASAEKSNDETPATDAVVTKKVMTQKEVVKKPAEVKIKGAKIQDPETLPIDPTPPVDPNASVSPTEPAVQDQPKAEEIIPAPEKKEEVAVETSKTESSLTGWLDDFTFSAVLRNLVSANYSKSTLVNKEATGTPEKNDRVIDLGTSYDLIKNNWTQLTLALEFKNLMHKNTGFNKSTHLGLEYTLSATDWFKPQFRLGMNQMYYTAGFGLNLSFVDIGFATYGEEIGTEKNKIENRVNAAHLSFNF